MNERAIPATCLGHQFEDSALLRRALTHRSAGIENNERLEYLGDAILGFVVAEALYERFPEASEGALTRLRAKLVKRETLAKLARSEKLGEYMLLGTGELKSGGWRRDSILANATEAVIGAIYLDAGMDVCRQRIRDLYADRLNSISPENVEKDPKTRLQEYLQARHLPLPSYQIIAETGEAHEREFTIECTVSELNKPIRAKGRSKQSAEQAAAERMLHILHEGG